MRITFDNDHGELFLLASLLSEKQPLIYKISDLIRAEKKKLHVSATVSSNGISNCSEMEIQVSPKINSTSNVTPTNLGAPLQPEEMKKRFMTITEDKVVLVPNKQQYNIGETAEVAVTSPFYPCEGLSKL